MDYQEAIETHINECRHRIDVINDFMESNEDADKDECNKNIEVLKTAISAMQELLEYKQKLNDTYGECDDLLRTVVDGLVRHEGIDIGNPIKSSMLTDEHVDLWEGYKQIGTLEEVRESVEKQKAKKPLVGGNTDKLTGDIRICPCCCGIVGIDDMRADYCADCGQHIDWSEVEE